jgi:hypothetical protein
MKKYICDIDRFDDFIESDFDWRRKELQLLKKELEKKEPYPKFEKIFLRAGIALLYAHWEGFIKSIAEMYLHHVYLQNKKFKELNIHFRALSLREVSNNKIDIEACKKIIIYMEESDEKAKFQYNKINTKSNLNCDVLLDILRFIGLESRIKIDYDGETIINDLVKTRNHIAHGENPQVTSKLFLEYHEKIISLMEMIKIEIQNEAAEKRYLHN